jgi:hypothetical protein
MTAFLSFSKNTTVLDIGGSFKNWSYLDDTPKLTLLNLSSSLEHLPVEIQYVCGDARKLPFNDHSFDVVFSNSVIEHVGCKSDQIEMAKEMMRVGKSYYCQTPNYWFPIEPHLIAPILHWLPVSIRGTLARWFSIWGWITKPSADKADEMTASIHLLKELDLHELFPDARLLNERVFGLVKSIVAVGLSNGTQNSKLQKNPWHKCGYHHLPKSDKSNY